MTVVHGGRLYQAAAEYGIPPEDWLDVSTGINPEGWPVPPLPPAVWSRLPEPEDGLQEAAQCYYGTTALLAVAGSQAAIQALPLLRSSCRVGILTPGYAEHARAWQQARHTVIPLTAEKIEAVLPGLDVLVVMNPNNPTGMHFSVTQLRGWHTALAARGGWLVVDEAFMDAAPEHSLASVCPLPGLIILRSPGKFFGLAGIRIGFVLAAHPICAALAARLGPWAVSTPARWVAKQALQDEAWQTMTRGCLQDQAARLEMILRACDLAPAGGCSLFQWVCTPDARQIRDRLARQGILVRHFDAPASLRFGLPAGAAAWARLEQALAGLNACG